MKIMECIILPKENLDKNEYIKDSYLDNLEEMSKEQLKALLNQIIKDTLIGVGRDNAKKYAKVSNSELKLKFSSELDAVTLSREAYMKIMENMFKENDNVK